MSELKHALLIFSDATSSPSSVLDSPGSASRDLRHHPGYQTYKSDQFDSLDYTYNVNNDERIPDIETIGDYNIEIVPVNMSWTVDEGDGHLKVILRWRKPDQTTDDYTILYARVSDSCNVDHHFPQCSEPSDHFEVVVNTSGKTVIVV